MELKLKLNVKNDRVVRGRNTEDSIFLFVSNIYKDSNRNFDDFIKGLNFIYVVEFTCRTAINESETYQSCGGKNYCPIAKILREYLYNYDIKLNNKERYKI